MGSIVTFQAEISFVEQKCGDCYEIRKSPTKTTFEGSQTSPAFRTLMLAVGWQPGHQV